MTMPVSGGGDANRNANVTLSADVSGYNQNMQAATQQTNVLSRAVDTLDAKLSGITKRAGKKLIQFSAGDFTSLGVATATAASFERQLGTLRVTADLSNQSFKDLKNGIENAFTKFPVARSQVIELTNAISNMGVTGTKNIGELTSTFIKLGASTGESMSGLAQGLIQVSRQMGNTNSTQIGNFANALLTVSKNAGVSASSVLTFANNIAPMARAAGIGEAAVLGISTAFSKAGADGFVGANAFNRIIGDINQDIATGSPDLAKYANLIGMTTDQFKQADKGKAFVQIVQAISKGGPEAINTLNRLGIDGVRAQSALQALAQSGDLQAQVNKAVGASTDQGNLNKGAKDAMSGLSDELAKLRNNFTQFGTEIGTSFLTPLEKIIGVLNRMFDVMNAVIKPFAPLIAGFGAIAGALGAIGGVGLLAAGAIAKIALARTLIGGTGVLAARQGFAVGRNPAVVNESAVRASNGQLNWYQRRFFQTGAGIGSLFPTIGRNAEETAARQGMSIGQRIRNGAIAAPFRAVNALGVSAQTRFLQQSSLRGYDRTPIVGGRGAAQASAAIIRNPVAAFRGARDAREETTAFAKSVKSAGASMDAVKVASVSAAAKINSSALANVEGAKASQVAAREAGVLAAAFGKLIVTVTATGAKQLGSGAAYVGARMGSGLLGMFGGPVGLAAMVGLPVGLGMYSHAKDQANKQNILSEDALNPIKLYNDQLGIATTNLATFASAVGSAADKTSNLNGVTATSNPKEVAKVSEADVQTSQGLKSSDKYINALAGVSGGKNNSSALQNLAQSYNMTDPRQLQMFKQNALASGFSPSVVQTALTNSVGQSTNDPFQARDFSPLSSAVQKTEGRRTGFLSKLPIPTSVLVNNPSGAGGTLRSAAISQIGTEYNTNQKHGQDYAAQKRLADESSYFGSYSSNFSGTVKGGKDSKEKAKRKELADALSQTFNGGDKKAAYTYGRALDKVNFDGMSDQERQQAIIKVIGSTSQGKNQLASVKTTDVGAFNTTLKSLYGSGQSDAVTEQLKDQGPTGRFALASANVQQAIQKPADTNLQFTALKDLAANAKETGQGFSGATEALDKLKAAIQDTTDPLYQLASAAQQYSARQQSYATPSLSRAGQAQVLSKNLSAAEKSTAPDAQAQLQSAQDAFQAGKEQNRQYLISMYQQAQAYGTQIARANDDQNLSITRANEDFHRNELYQQQDFDKQRTRNVVSYNLQISRQNADFATSQLYQQQDFNKSRIRSERDFGIQMTRQTQQTAKTIYDPYSQVQSKYTSDAGSLLLNLEDQNKRIIQQREQVQKALNMGLSQQSVDTLQLADPNQAQQLNSVVDQLTSDPSMIAKINKQVQQRLTGTRSLVQNNFSDSFRNTVSDFTKSLNDATKDFNQSRDRSVVSQRLSLSRMAADFNKSMSQSSADFNVARDRAVASQSLALDRQAADFKKMVSRSATDLQTAMTEIYGSFEDLFPKTLDKVNTQIGKYAPGAAKLIGDQLKALHNEYFPAGNAAGMAAGDKGLTQSQLNSKYGWGGHALGGISTQEHLARVSERNKAETIIPLDQRGQNYMAGMYYAVAKSVVQQMQTSGGMKMVGQGSSTFQTYQIDSSTNFTGAITVQAQDPRAMQLALEQQKRIAKLTRPPRATAANAA